MFCTTVKMTVGTTELVFDAAAIQAIAGKEVTLQVKMIAADEESE